MNTNGSLLFKEEVFQIAGCAFAALNTLKDGVDEKLYENSLTVNPKLERERIVL